MNGRLDALAIKELDYVQQDLSKHTALSVSEKLAAPKVTSKKDSGSGKAEASDDFSMFDCPLLGLGAQKVPPEKDDFEDFGMQSELEEFEDFADILDIDADVDAISKLVEHGASSGPRAAGSAVPHKKDLDLDAASVGSGGFQVKTIATEKTLIEEALTEIGRLFSSGGGVCISSASASLLTIVNL